MLVRRLLLSSQVLKSQWNCALRYSSQHMTRNQQISNLEARLPDHRPKNAKRGPFVKNLCYGIFDEEFLVFPEPVAHDRYLDFMTWIKPIEEYVDNCIQSKDQLNTDDVISHIKQLGVLRSAVNTLYDGLECSETEITKITETLSAIPWLGTFYIKNHVLPVRLLTKYGTSKQKAKYLPEIANGTIIPTICVIEKHNRTSIESIDTRLTNNVNNSEWMLNGEKNFVTNATSANLYMVITNVVESHQPMSTFGLVFVEADAPGVKCINKEITVGQQEIPQCTVRFNNVKVMDENVVKNDSEDDFYPIVDILSPGRQATSPQAVAILKRFLKLLTQHVLETKHLDQNMHQWHIVQHILAQITASLYAMESMTYYTSAIADEFEDQDLLIEKTITEIFCATECVNNILEGLKLIGSKSYLRTEPYIKLLEDAMSLVTFDMSEMDSQIYIGLLTLQHCGKIYKDTFVRPKDTVDDGFFSIFKKRTEEVVQEKKLDIGGHLHPSMKIGAHALTESLPLIKRNITDLFKQHAAGISERQEELRRLSETIVYIYRSVATLSRASRSFCIGLRHCNEERNLAVIMAVEALYKLEYHRLKLNPRAIRTDEKYRELSECLYQSKEYFISHALERIK